MKYFALAASFVILGCSDDSGPRRWTTQQGGSPNSGGMTNAGGSLPSSGGAANGGTTSVGTGGASFGGMSGGFSAGGSGNSQGGASGGVGAGGRTTAGGGNASSGGNTSNGGKTSAGGNAAGGKASGGAGNASGGATATGGAGGATSTAGATALDCNAMMPTNGTKHTGLGQGGKDNLAWQLWANSANNGSITTFSTPAFSAEWNNAGDYLARIGYEWGNAGKAYETYGQISAQFAYKRTGTAGGYSYIGIYGWSTNPCVEWYIVDDSYGMMPVNPGNTTNKGTVRIDEGDYILYTRQTTGTGGSRCSGTSSWAQYYSIRKTARQCGTISITKHFDAWKAATMPLGNLLEAKILVEVGGGAGSVEFPLANVTLAP
jgi:endo-1,4-beta-xylanase